MSRFVTEFYDYATGVNFDMGWADEEQFRRGKAFLDELTGGAVGNTQRPDAPPYYILETEEQRDAMLQFRRQLRDEAAAVTRIERSQIRD